MKKIIFLITFIITSSVFEANAQAYVKFSEQPAMELKVARQFHNYSVAYNALGKSTIYIELKQGNKLVGNSVYDITKAGEKKVKLTVSIFKGVGELKEGNNYSYSLYMYEGGRNDWSKKACETVVIDSVRVVNRNVKKPSISVNTFN